MNFKKVQIRDYLIHEDLLCKHAKPRVPEERGGPSL